jgi:signal recognition particle subunit SRP54
MFESLSEKLQNALQSLRGKTKVTEDDLGQALREVRLALLEADVNLQVVKDFINKIRDRATGVEVLEGLNPVQQVVKIVDEELTNILGGTEDDTTLHYATQPPTVWMLVGLQGSGKTTHAGKLAHMLRRQGRKPMLVACDIYRPAAIKQLEVVGAQVGVPVFTLGDKVDPAEIAKKAVAEAIKTGCDLVIIDTAGRLQIDQPLMNELKRIKSTVDPIEILLVLDSMSGQEAANVARGFNDVLDVDGFILTKLDSDTRGGAALSLKTVANKPIKLIGVGEKMEALEVFHADRMAQRILGMGDVLSLIEKVSQDVDAKQAAAMEKKLRANSFDLGDFLEQMRQMKKLGPLENILKMLPGVGSQIKDLQVDEKHIARIEAMILSMTLQERKEPGIINGSRRRRIATGSGMTVQDVNKLLTQFQQMRQMVKGFVAMEDGGRSGRRPVLPGGMQGATGKHAGSNKKNKKHRKGFPFGR